MDMLEAKLNPYLIYCLCNESITNQIPGKGYKSRVTKYHELELITAGNGTMKVNNNLYNLEQGDLFYYPPNTKITGTMPYGYILLIFDPYFSEVNLHKYGEGKKSLGDDITSECIVCKDLLPLSPHINVSNFNTYRASFKKIFSLFVKSGNTLENKLNMLKLLYELKNEFNKKTNYGHINKKSYYEKIEHCAQIISIDPEFNYSLEKLAVQVSLSKNFLCTAFKEITGVTIFSYIHEKRIEKAKEMLIETHSSIEEIALACGFENVSYFYRTFKKYNSVSPAVYRQHYRL
jgi:AraC-type DNA-binding domain-containing proteins